MRRRFLKTSKDVISNYLTIEALEDGLTVSLKNAYCWYCVDGDKQWKLLENNIVTINSGQTVSFKNASYSSYFGCGIFEVNKKFNLVGNAMSMLFGDKAKTVFDLSNYPKAFSQMFSTCYTLQSVSPNLLPATTLSDSCYDNMFYGCSSLTTSPKLPATTLALDCYHSMFYGTNVLPDCSNINFSSSAIISSGGLRGLFAGTKVTDADLFVILPINPSTGKYWLPATTLADYCYYYMFNDCTGLTTAPELPATTLALDCYHSMFYGCTGLTTVPELPATTLVRGCYYKMFQGCTKLNYIKMLATSITAGDCLYNWVFNVSSTGTFVKNPDMTTLPTATSSNYYAGIPSGWTVVNNGDE